MDIVLIIGAIAIAVSIGELARRTVQGERMSREIENLKSAVQTLEDLRSAPQTMASNVSSDAQSFGMTVSIPGVTDRESIWDRDPAWSRQGLVIYKQINSSETDRSSYGSSASGGRSVVPMRPKVRF